MSQTVKPGYKRTEVGVIPEDWEVKPFTQVTDLITCGIAATPDYVSESQGYPFLSSTNVKEGRIVWSGYKHISAVLHRQLYRNNPPRRGDILYSRVGTFGEAGVVDVDFEFSVYVSLTLIKPGKALDSCYLMQLLNSNAYKQRAKDHIYLGGGVGNLNVDIVRRYPIVVPPLPEQRAIATALSDVDALLAALDRLIAKQRDLKQAAMQQLLTGQTRLPGFTGKWEDTTLGEIGQCIIGLTYKPENVVEHGLLVLRSSNVQNGRLAYYDNVHVNLKVADHLYTRLGDILICVRNGSRALIGKCAVIDDAASGVTFGAFMSVYRTKHWRFIIHAFQSGDIQHQIRDNIGATINQITNKDMKAFRVKLPPEDEQTAIATVLSDMDMELAALEQRRDKTRALKQGMMQELLTGRTRLV